MNPQLDKSPGLPFASQPAMEQSQVSFNGAQGAFHSPETLTMGSELPPAGGIPMQSLGLPAATIPTSAIPTANQHASQNVQTQAYSGDDGANDLDQEWISKAKAIVEKTRNDPYIQSMEISKVKADYLRVKHNKHIKVTEDKA